MKNSRGVSLIEVLIVLALAVLAISTIGIITSSRYAKIFQDQIGIPPSETWKTSEFERKIVQPLVDKRLLELEEEIHSADDFAAKQCLEAVRVADEEIEPTADAAESQLEKLRVARLKCREAQEAALASKDRFEKTKSAVQHFGLEAR